MTSNDIYSEHYKAQEEWTEQYTHLNSRRKKVNRELEILLGTDALRRLDAAIKFYWGEGN
jgi:hypothetical protein